MKEEIKQESVVHKEDEQPAQQVAVQSSQENTTTDQKPQEKPKSDHDLNWKKAREIMKAQSLKISELEAHVNRLNMPKEKDEFENVDKDDYITFEQAQRVAENANKKVEKRAQEIASQIVEERLQVVEGERLEEKTRAKYQDYDYVIDNFAIPMIEKNPALANAIKSSPNWAEVAYRFAKSSPEYEAELAKRQNSQNQQDVDKVLKNQERPIPSSAAGSSLKSQVEQFATLSPEEIWKRAKEYAKKA